MIGKFKYSSHLIYLVIVCLLVIAMYSYHVNRDNELIKAAAEHAELLAEPLWNYDNTLIDNFLSVLIARKEYQKIELFGIDGEPISKVQSEPFTGFPKFLHAIHLLPVNELSVPIAKDQDKIGEITISWRDTSIYFYANATLVALLLIVISWLYGSVTRTNKTLKSKIKDLHEALNEVKKQKDYIENIYNVVPEGLITFNKEQKPVDWNNSFDRIVETWSEALGKERNAIQQSLIQSLLEELQQRDKGEYSIAIDNCRITISFVSSFISGFENIDRVISLYDITDMVQMRRRLTQAEKLESVGRLAAGIAHEINTPTQYVLTNLHFLTEAFEDLTAAINSLGKWPSETSQQNSTEFASIYAGVLEETDWEYLEGEIPHALEQSTEGMQRIQTIVSAMKHFSHPSGDAAEICDLNQAIESTVTIARNEWKLVADLKLDLDPELPSIPCFIDQINQVILNMIVNAAHAIEEKLSITGESRGNIEISTQPSEQFIEIQITDNGIGMTEDVKRKIFDPFFTTKEVNKGTGQGLAIANDIIVNKHKGAINVISTESKGTTFFIQLPYDLEKSTTV